MRFASWFTAALVATAATCLAQTAPAPIPLLTTSGTGFNGAPYAGRETTVAVKPLADGTTTTQTFVQLLWRDADGRTRSEHVLHTDSGVEYHSVVVTDPVAGVYLKWTTGNEAVKPVVSIWPVARAQTKTAPAAPSPVPRAGLDSTVLPPGLQRETLPPQEINGVYSEGTRTIRTIHLGEERDNRVIKVTNELWISPDLRIIVRHIMDGPRTGTSTTNLTDVVRGDSDSSLFQPPEGYQLVDHRAKTTQ
jgi:hypothetical protein